MKHKSKMREECFLFATIALRVLWAASLWTKCSCFGPSDIHARIDRCHFTGMNANAASRNRRPRSTCTLCLSSASDNTASPASDGSDDGSIGNGGNEDDQDNDKDEDHEQAVPSTPCTRICRYNANFYDGQVCIGCYRDTFEISTWDGMSAMEKSFACLDAADRITPADTVDGGDDGTDEEFGGAISRQELERQARYWEKIASG
mmetsp:Transcript_6476/g.14147  ORF Transcript_6476/g.14147 Transcript_6476/m.14147 type:complete len:204 (+) Transcript_6476:220-831(+)